MPSPESNNILFTGAGFTANWGGFLNQELWSQIFNHEKIQKNRKLKGLLQQYFSFEYVLEIVQSNPSYSNDDREEIWAAINSAFDKMDSIIVERAENWPYVQPIEPLIEGLFRKKRGYFFTVNQDLFVERFLLGTQRSRPGILPRLEFPPRTKMSLKEWGLTKVPSAEEIKQSGDNYSTDVGPQNIAYIKLHGSHDWISSSGSSVKVIGGGKKDKIEGEPILAFYSRFFVDVLSKKNNKILIIGYGFRDEHINKALGDAVKNYDLRIYVICPEDPKLFRNNILVNFCADIWDGISGYYPYDLKRFLSSNRYIQDLLRSIHFDSDLS